MMAANVVATTTDETATATDVNAQATAAVASILARQGFTADQAVLAALTELLEQYIKKVAHLSLNVAHYNGGRMLDEEPPTVEDVAQTLQYMKVDFRQLGQYAAANMERITDSSPPSALPQNCTADNRTLPAAIQSKLFTPSQMWWTELLANTAENPSNSADKQAGKKRSAVATPVESEEDGHSGQLEFEQGSSAPESQNLNSSDPANVNTGGDRTKRKLGDSDSVASDHLSKTGCNPKPSVSSTDCQIVRPAEKTVESSNNFSVDDDCVISELPNSTVLLLPSFESSTEIHKLPECFQVKVKEETHSEAEEEKPIKFKKFMVEKFTSQSAAETENSLPAVSSDINDNSSSSFPSAQHLQSVSSSFSSPTTTTAALSTVTQSELPQQQPPLLPNASPNDSSTTTTNAYHNTQTTTEPKKKASTAKSRKRSSSYSPNTVDDHQVNFCASTSTSPFSFGQCSNKATSTSKTAPKKSNSISKITPKKPTSVLKTASKKSTLISKTTSKTKSTSNATSKTTSTSKKRSKKDICPKCKYVITSLKGFKIAIRCDDPDCRQRYHHWCTDIDITQKSDKTVWYCTDCRNQRKYLCGVCFKYDDPNSYQQATKWVKCDGCNWEFHYSCARITKAPPGEEPFFCRTCVKRQKVLLKRRDLFKQGGGSKKGKV